MKKQTLLSIIFILLSGITGKAQILYPELHELIKDGIEKNHSLKSNEYKIQSTGLDRKRAWQSFLPKITLNANYARLDKDIVLDEDLQKLLSGTQSLLIKEALGIPFHSPLPPQIPVQEIPPIQKKDVYKSSIDGEWLLFSGLKVYHTDQALKHKQNALAYQQEIIKKNTIEKITESYLNLGLLYASEKVLDQTENYVNKQNEYVVKAIKNGLTTGLDLQKIELAGKEMDLKRLELNNNKQLIYLQLSQLTGKNVEELKNIRPDLKSIIVPDFENKALTRVEIKALSEGIEAKKALKKSELDQYIPKIAAKGHYELTDKSLTMLDPKWYVGIGIKWDVFDGLNALNKAKKINLEIASDTERLTETQELIQLQQRQAQLNYKKSLKEIEMRKQEVKLAENTYALSLKKYKNGLINITSLLESMNRLEKARLDLKKAYYKQNKAAVSLLNAFDVLNRQF